MSDTQAKPIFAWRISLREMLMLVAVLAAGCVALKYASPTVAGIVLGALLIVWGAMAIYALVGRSLEQAFAIGFILITLGYTASGYLSGLVNRFGVMPTEELLTMLHEQMATDWEVDSTFGEWIRPYQPSDDPTITVIDADYAVPPIPPRAYPAPVGPSQTVPVIPTSFVYVKKYPSATDFMAVGNGLCALFLAYLGGKFAVSVYLRRLDQEQTQTH